MATNNHSLPSFAQAFSTSSLGNISSNNALPPIHSQRVPSPASEAPSSTARKRSRNTPREDDHDHDHSDRESPRIVRIKEEQEYDMLEQTPPPPTQDQRLLHDSAPAPPPSSFLPPSKKRRVTVSGAPHPLNTDVRVSADQTNSTPISPVVMGFTIKRDNPSAIEQVRSMITVKQKQKALIEQRRGSVVGAVLPPGPSTGNPPPPPPADDRNMAPAKVARPSRRSPNTGVGARRIANVSGQGSGNTRPPSPSSIIVPTQQPIVPSQVPSAHSLPPPPISFARRQLGAGKRKPADIVISPREAQTPEQFQPAIQSAPPIPHAGQGSFYMGRLPMSLPRLPAMGGGDNVRRVASNVPPTPTRLSMQHVASTSAPVSHPIPGLSGRSPPAASVPIASTLVPPTPSSLGYSGDKSAFLAQFEVFYDALNDSKQLKNWLSEQLQKSNSLMQSLTQQQEKLNETVEVLVEKKVSGMRVEMEGLHRRVEELEDALRVATSARRRSIDATGGAKAKGKQPLRNGVSTGPVAPEAYTFPPVDHTRLIPSPAWGQDRDPREHQNAMESENESPAPFDARRHSVSATRLDPLRPQAAEVPAQGRSSFPVHSPPIGFRDGSSASILPPPTPHGRTSRSNNHLERERPQLPRQPSHPRLSTSVPSAERVPSPQPPLAQVQVQPKRADSRRNSIVVSPPQAPAGGDDG